jgi:hypothetical protein
MTEKELQELYSDYLIASFGQTSATGLSRLVGGSVSHDQVTRFLSSRDFTSQDLWYRVKPTLRDIESDDGVLIIDDTIQEKPHTDENELVCWHFDHTKNRSVKGVNLLNCCYHANGTTLPVCFELVKKPTQYSDIKTRQVKRKSKKTKNELFRSMLTTCRQNQIAWSFALADSWFASTDNMIFVHDTMNKHFIFAMKTNRLVALSETDKQQGRFARIDSLSWSGKPVQGWIKGVPFPVLLHRQVFTNKDGSTAELYLACSDLSCDADTIETIYKKRWKVEVFHKTIKSNTALAKSPTKRVRTQSNHLFMAIYAGFRLECLSIASKMNHFAIKGKLYVNAIRQAFQELNTMKNALSA